MKNIKHKTSSKPFSLIRKIVALFFVSFVIVNGGQLFAQQLPHYSNYMLNGYAINPAMGGVNPYFEAMSNNRYQWVGITDAPRTYVLTVNGPTKSLNVGLGGMLFTDIVGPTRRTGCYMSYAYHFKVADKIKVSFGISGGLLQYMVDASKITLRDVSDQVISNGIQSVVTPDFGAGIYAYSTNKKWYAGLSAPQLFQNKIVFKEIYSSSLSKLATHFYATGGYRYTVNENFKIEPSIMLKYVKPAPLQFDLGLRAIYRDKVWLGTVYRYLDAVSVIVGYNMKQNLTFAYSYDFTTSNIRKYSTGTHEIVIGIRFHKIEKAVESSGSTPESAKLEVPAESKK